MRDGVQRTPPPFFFHDTPLKAHHSMPHAPAPCAVAVLAAIPLRHARPRPLLHPDLDSTGASSMRS